MEFDLLDEVFWRVKKAGSVGLAPIETGGSSHLGPLVECEFGRANYPEANQILRFNGRDAAYIKMLASRSLRGVDFNARFGLFPMVALAGKEGHALWELWCMRLQQAAEHVGFSKPVAQGMVGATRELADNIKEHSEHEDTGLIAFRADGSVFEIVVADAGVGVLNSLRRSQVYSYLRDAGTALRLAVTDGQSRTSDPKRGYGISEIFRALAGFSGKIRFRSGDHALTIEGDVLSLEGKVTIAQRAPYPGLTVSIQCRPSRVAS